MFTQISGPDHHFNAYDKDNSILIQFIMVEFVQTYQLTFQIKTLVQDRLDNTQTFDTLYPSLIQILGQLVGCFSQQERPSFSPWVKGSLTKLKEYCEQFSRNSMQKNKEHVNLHMAAHQAWLTAIHNLEILNSSYINRSQENAEPLLFLISIKRAFNILQIRFNHIIRNIPRIIKDYWNNENVILCLLRKRPQLVEIYGSDFLTKRFKWPIKNKELVRILVERYQERGFEALLPTIHLILNAEESSHDLI